MRMTSLALGVLATLAVPAAAGEADGRRLSSSPRDGYVLERWELYPERELAVEAFVLIPDGAAKGATPAAIFMPDDATSIECLAGEPDPYASANPDGGRLAYFAVKGGRVAAALAKPAMANAAPDDVSSEDSWKRYRALLPGSGWDHAKLVRAELDLCRKVLARATPADPERIEENPKVARPPDAAPPPPRPEGPVKARGRRLMRAADYEPERADGRTRKTMTWAMLKLRQAAAPKPRPYLRNKAAFEAWRAKRLETFRRYARDRDSRPTFKLLKSERRDGYEQREYEFYPFDGLAVRTYILYPDDAKPGKTPVVVCMPGGCASLESLVGDRARDAYFTRYPTRNRQCWYYAKCGMIAVALENPANASNTHPDFHIWHSMVAANKYWGKAGFPGAECYIVRTVSACIDFLKADPRVDRTKIACSGLSRGASILFAAAGNPDVRAMNYNDFVCDSTARRIATTDLPSGMTEAGGADIETLMALAPMPLLLNEGGAYKGVIEDIARAYALSGHPENLTVHYYDRYRNPRDRRHENVDVRTVTGLTPEGFFAYSNCDAYDHSFHPESALPWLCRLFGGAGLPDALDLPLLQAKAEREWLEEEYFPPDGHTGRKSWGARPFDEAALTPERPDGRTVYTATWAKMLADGKARWCPEGASASGAQSIQPGKRRKRK